MVSRYYATNELLNNNITTLPITVEHIEKIITSRGFVIITYDTNCNPHIETLEELGVLSLAKRTKAFTYISKSEKLVFIECGISTNDRRLLLAHELGHIVLGHMSDNCIVGYKPGGLIDEGQEDEANAFALEFLAPVCVLDRKHYADVNTISAVTLLDEKRSKLVADEIRNHKKFTESELALCEQFENPPKPKRRRKVLGFVIRLTVSLMLSAAVMSLTYTMIKHKETPKQLPPEQTTPEISHEEIISTDYVVVTKTGKKYHLSGCRHIANKENLMHMTVEEAETAGYEPCEDCKPNK